MLIPGTGTRSNEFLFLSPIIRFMGKMRTATVSTVGLLCLQRSVEGLKKQRKPQQAKHHTHIYIYIGDVVLSLACSPILTEAIVDVSEYEVDR